MISADWLLPRTLVEIGKLAVVEPAGTVTLAGTVAAVVLSLDSATVKPPEGAATVKRTVPVDAFPPTTSVGLTVTDDSDVAPDGVVVLTVQPDKVAVAAVAEPSLTLTRQSLGLANGSRWILKLPAESLVPSAAPFTVMVRFAIAAPSRRSCVPLSSARVMRTSAAATGAVTPATTTTMRLTHAARRAPDRRGR